MSYYEQLKSSNDIIIIAKQLGFNGARSGRSINGECPRHASSSGKCLVIWPGIQGFKCYHCGQSGDVIDLVMLFRHCDHVTAVKFLADRVGMPHLTGGKELSAEEKAKRQSETREEQLVYDMLTEAAKWYHTQLKKFPDIVDHLQTHYGFSAGIVEELKIGFAPPGTSAPEISSDLAAHLETRNEFVGHLAQSGLFTFTSPTGRIWDYFKGRIIFPYWKHGKVVNMIARATSMTPADQYECYSDKEGNARTDDDGRPQYIKYKKLRRHDSDDDKRRHISKFIGTETFMGTDSIRGAKEIIITEGAPDWVSAVDFGFSAISPVTTNFREKDFEKLSRETSGADAIYIINDNEENLAGLKGALKTAMYLTRRERKVFLVELPRPDGIEKVDLNEYLQDHTAKDLRELMNQSKSMLDILIGKLPADFIKAQPILKTEIMPLLLGFGESIREHYLDSIRKKVKTSKAALTAELDGIKRDIAAQEKQSSQAQVDPEVQTLAETIAKDPALIRKRIDVVNDSGVVGERNVVAMYFAALDSRLLPEDTASPNALAQKNAGHHGSGKSYTLKRCLELYHQQGYHLITGGSAKSLYYLETGLQHRALIVTEAFQFQTNNATDSEFVYAVRSLLSEGRVSYQVPEKDDVGKFITVEKRLDGPTSFITTTTIDKLEPQLEDRLFTIHPDESMEQTRAIMSMTAAIKDGSFKGIEKKTGEAWKRFHSMLKPVEVLIPYAGKISEYIQQQSKLPIATRRAFNRVMAIIQTVACAYQFQRSRDGKGRLVAEICDYWMALQIVREAFCENLGQQSKEAEQRIEFIRENGPLQYNTLTSEWGISKSALTGWVRGKVYDNLLVWCDELGGEFTDDAVLKKAKRSGVAYLKVNDDRVSNDFIGLPTPFELTGDLRWADGGEFLHFYDLKLDWRKTRQTSTANDTVIAEVPYEEAVEGNLDDKATFSFEQCQF